MGVRIDMAEDNFCVFSYGELSGVRPSNPMIPQAVYALSIRYEGCFNNLSIKY